MKIKILIVIPLILSAIAWSTTWQNKIEKECQRYGEWSQVLSSVCQEESSFRPYTNSSMGARGAFQIMPKTLDHINVLAKTNFKFKDMYDYKKCMYASYIYMKWLKKCWDGDLYMMFASYHRGRGAVQKKGVKSPKYCMNIMNRIKKMPKGTYDRRFMFSLKIIN